MFKESMKNIFSRLKKIRLNKLVFLLLAVALCAIALALVICYIMSTAHPPVNIEVNLHLTENYAGLESNPILGAAAGLVGSVINWQSQREANKMNMKINQMNNEFNRVEAEKQRNWQSVEWLRQFNAQNAYNDPQNAMARLKLAGINPFIAAENTTKIGSTAANPSVPSAASATAASPLAMRAPNFDLSPFVQMAQAASLMADAKNKGVNTEMLEKNLNTWLKTNEAELERLNLTNHMQAMLNDFEGDFGRSRRTYELSLVANQAMLALAQEGEAIANKAVLEKKIDEIIANAEYKQAEKDWLIEQKPYLIKKIQTETRTIEKQGNMYDAQATSALAVARNQIEQADTEAALRDSKKGLLDAQQGATKADMLAAIAAMYDKLERLGMDKSKFAPELDDLKNRVVHGKIENTREFVNLLYLPAEKNAHLFKIGTEGFKNIVPW